MFVLLIFPPAGAQAGDTMLDNEIEMQLLQASRKYLFFLMETVHRKENTAPSSYFFSSEGIIELLQPFCDHEFTPEQLT